MTIWLSSFLKGNNVIPVKIDRTTTGLKMTSLEQKKKKTMNPSNVTTLEDQATILAEFIYFVFYNQFILPLDTETFYGRLKRFVQCFFFFFFPHVNIMNVTNAI